MQALKWVMKTILNAQLTLKKVKPLHITTKRRSSRRLKRYKKVPTLMKVRTKDSTCPQYFKSPRLHHQLLKKWPRKRKRLLANLAKSKQIPVELLPNHPDHLTQLVGRNLRIRSTSKISASLTQCLTKTQERS